MSNVALKTHQKQSYPTPEEVNRNRLLDACVEAVGQHGLRDLQMSHVIEGAGLSRRTAYKYFKNKSTMVDAAFLREGARLFEGARQEVSACTSIEDIFVYSFLYIYQHLPRHPLMRELIHHNRELTENLNVGKNMMDALEGLDLKALFDDYPQISRDIYALSEYWVQVILSFILLRSGENKSLKEVEAYVRKRFVPGLCLGDYNLSK